MSRQSIEEQARQEVADFNRRYEVGTEGVLRRDSGVEFWTRLRSTAWVLNGQSAVAMFDGVSGCYRIDRFRPDEGQP